MNGLFGKIAAITILILMPVVWGVTVSWMFSRLRKHSTAGGRENSQS